MRKKTAIETVVVVGGKQQSHRARKREKRWGKI